MKPSEQKPADTLQRTDWFEPSAKPTIPGSYECTLGAGSGHTFMRKFDGEGWHSPITNLRSRVELPWRGIVPGSIDINQYPRSLHFDLQWPDRTHSSQPNKE